ncbi:DUF6542 domain-containing protein [Streptomyces sp. JB150]|uniref:DUF6542 domain-containing protein n=1 Tax=Streptomyces sp. JB150 TaxID=2714844 RepID=UPI00140DFE02|nr:hypothetical protein G7Z13_22700 [Streptomyces sp. JB150]
MEQHRTRSPQQHGPRRGTSPPLPPQATRGGGGRPPAPRQGSQQPKQGAQQPPQGAQQPRQPRSQPPRPPARPASPARPARSGRPAPQRDATSVRRPAPPPARAPRRLPNPRLTGLGCGLFCGTLMLTLGFLDRLLFGASPLVYGVLFLPVCVLTGLWVRRGDLVTAPVVVPIAFALGLFPITHADGFGSRLMALFTALATQAGWLYGGTLIVGSIVTVRKVRLMAQRAAVARRRPATGA